VEKVCLAHAAAQRIKAYCHQVLSMNRFLLIPVLAFCLPVAAQTDEASLHAKAQQLVLALHTDRMVKQASDRFSKQYSDTAEHIVGNNPTPQQATQIADFEKKLSQTIDTQMDWSVVGPGFVDVYAKTFTEAELDAIIAFYKSPAGVAFLDRTPALNAQTMQLLQSKLAAIQPQLKLALDDFRKNQAPPAATLQFTQPGIAPK
jgi:hypothetical protein